MKTLWSALLIVVLASCQQEPSETSECKQAEARMSELATDLDDAKAEPLPSPTSGDPQIEQRNSQWAHDEKVNEAYEALVEESAILARQHPQCFEVAERSLLEARYQQIRDQRTQQEDK